MNYVSAGRDLADIGTGGCEPSARRPVAMRPSHARTEPYRNRAVASPISEARSLDTLRPKGRYGG